MSTPMSNEGIWQRFVNVVDPPKWVDIDPSEKDEWERLGYPVRELVPATTLSSQAAEIAELRMALTEIKRLKSEPIGDTGFSVGPLVLFHAAQRIAKEALSRRVSRALTRKEG